MKGVKVHSLRSLRREMKTVARGERPAPPMRPRLGGSAGRAPQSPAAASARAKARPIEVMRMGRLAWLHPLGLVGASLRLSSLPDNACVLMNNGAIGRIDKYDDPVSTNGPAQSGRPHESKPFRVEYHQFGV